MLKFDKNRLKVEECYENYFVLQSSLEDQLYWACESQDVEAAKNLLSKKGNEVDLNQLRENGYNLLHEAVFRNNSEFINLLVLHKANVNIISASGLTPLHIASSHGFLEAAEILLRFGADFELRNTRGQSSLFCAVHRGKTKIVDLFLKHAKTLGDHYTLCESIIRGRKARSLTNLPENSQYKAESPLVWAVKLNRSEWIKFLLQAGAEVEQPSYSLLHTAILKNNHQVIRDLLVHGANVERFSKDPESSGNVTPLYLAASRNQVEIVQLLLKHGAQPNRSVSRRHGNTALHVCAIRGHVDCLKNLLLHGANPNLCNNYSDTPLNLACVWSKTEIVKLLVLNGANLEKQNKKGLGPLQNACMRGYAAIVQILLDAGANMKVRNNVKQTILHLQVQNDKPEFLKFLLKRCDLELIKAKDWWGKTPLMATSAYGSCKNLEILMRHGAHVDELQDFKECRDEACPATRHIEKLGVLNGTMKNEDSQRELEKMKKIRISSYPRGVTLYDLIFSNKNHMMRYADNEILAGMDDFEAEFPIYGFLLNLNCRKGRLRKSRVWRAQEFLLSILGQRLPDFCMNKIFDHLSNDQLDKVINF